MSTLTRTRRMPEKYRLRADGTTQIVYSVTPEVIVVLPGTRWLEQRREREARLAAEAALEQESFMAPESAEVISEPVADVIAESGDENFGAVMFDTELTEIEAGDGVAPELPCVPDEMGVLEPLSWTDRMRIATTRLFRRQNPWLPSLRGNAVGFGLSTQD